MKHKLAITTVWVFALMALMAPALANHNYQEHVPKEEPDVIERAPEVPKAPDVVGGGEVLPITGSELMAFVAAGSLTIAIGAAMVKRNPSRPTQS